MPKADEHSTTLMLVAAIVCCAALSPAIARAQTPVRSVSLSPPPAAGEPIGAWGGGAFLTIEGHSTGAPLLRIYDPSGMEAERIGLQIPGGEGILLMSHEFTRSATGYLAFAGTAYGDGDRAGGFLAIVSPDRTSQRVVRTEPYVPFAVTFAPDGTIWTAGPLKDDSGRDVGDAASYSMIHRFDIQGRPLRGAVPRSTFPGPETPVGGSFFVTSKDRVGWVSPLAHRYMEFSLDGTLLASYPFAFSLEDVSGAALCDDGTLWMSVKVKPDPKSSVTGPRNALASFDRATGAWHEGPTQPPFYLYGRSGNTLITITNGNNLNWLAAR
jgi:hypothetical protein